MGAGKSASRSLFQSLGSLAPASRKCFSQSCSDTQGERASGEMGGPVLAASLPVQLPAGAPRTRGRFSWLWDVGPLPARRSSGFLAKSWLWWTFEGNKPADGRYMCVCVLLCFPNKEIKSETDTHQRAMSPVHLRGSGPLQAGRARHWATGPLPVCLAVCSPGLASWRMQTGGRQC